MKKLFNLRVLLGLLAIGFFWITGVPEEVRSEGSATYASSNVPAPAPSQRKVVLKNLGMSCPFCKAAVSAKLKQVPGVIAYDVDWRSDSATVLYDPSRVTIEELKQAIAQTGFQVRGVEEVSK